MALVRLPALLLITALISGCTNYAAPVTSLAQPPSIKIMTHQVAAGDTLYSIAWRYDLDYRSLGSVNGLRPPYRLEIGQVLSLDMSDAEPIAYARSASDASNRPTKKPVRSKIQDSTTINKVSYAKELRWQWPVKGEVVEGYNPKKLRKGWSIKTVSGSMVRPAAPGVVVYVGDGLRGYGKLIIIKHSDIILSAYAHNEKILVKEGQQVKNTEIISKLGYNGTLYFEIREDGYPVNPRKYIE